VGVAVAAVAVAAVAVAAVAVAAVAVAAVAVAAVAVAAVAAVAVAAVAVAVAVAGSVNVTRAPVPLPRSGLLSGQSVLSGKPLPLEAHAIPLTVAHVRSAPHRG
jgi:hypothetical protein